MRHAMLPFVLFLMAGCGDDDMPNSPSGSSLGFFVTSSTSTTGLGPYCKVPTMTFYSEADELVPAHVDATGRLCRAMRSPLTMLHADDVALVASALDGFSA